MKIPITLTYTCAYVCTHVQYVHTLSMYSTIWKVRHVQSNAPNSLCGFFHAGEDGLKLASWILATPIAASVGHHQSVTSPYFVLSENSWF